MTTRELDTLTSFVMSNEFRFCLFYPSSKKLYYSRKSDNQEQNYLRFFERVSVLLYGCKHHFLPLNNHKDSFRQKPIYYLDTIHHVDAISRQTYSFPTKGVCDSNPAKVVALEPDRNGF